MRWTEIQDGVKVRHLREGWVGYVYKHPRDTSARRSGFAYGANGYNYHHMITTFLVMRDWPEKNSTWTTFGRSEDFEVVR